MDDKPVIAITMGDPCGIGPEVIAKALASGEIYPLCRPVVIGNAWAMAEAVKLVGTIHASPLQVRQVRSSEGTGEDPHTIDVLDSGNLSPSDITPGQPSAACGRAVAEWRSEARRLVTSGQAQACIMAPVNSDALKMAGVYEAGDTEQGYRFLITGPLRVVHLTDHISIRELPDAVKKEKVRAVLQLVHDSLERWGIPTPRIGVAGLNPHAVGKEEQEEIIPAIEEARKAGINAIGPVPPDTVFRQCAEGQYDVVLAMSHDQGHIAVKTYKFEGTASISLGRPYIQCGVAHGTAFDIVGKGIASPANMLEALKLAATLSAGKGFPKS